MFNHWCCVNISCSSVWWWKCTLIIRGVYSDTQWSESVTATTTPPLNWKRATYSTMWMNTHHHWHFCLYNTFIIIIRSNKQPYLNMFFPNTSIRLMWPDLYVNKVGCYLHDTNKPTSKTEIITDTKKRRLLTVDKLIIRCVTEDEELKKTCEQSMTN